MEIVNVLKQYSDLVEEVEDLQARIIILETEEERIERDMVHGSMHDFPYCQTSIKIEGLSTQDAQRKIKSIARRKAMLKQLLQEVDEQKEICETFIASVDNSQMRQAIRYRYMDRLTWKDISIKLDVDENAIKLKVFRFLKKSENETNVTR